MSSNHTRCGVTLSQRRRITWWAHVGCVGHRLDSIHSLLHQAHSLGLLLCDLRETSWIVAVPPTNMPTSADAWICAIFALCSLRKAIASSLIVFHYSAAIDSCPKYQSKSKLCFRPSKPRGSENRLMTTILKLETWVREPQKSVPLQRFSAFFFGSKWSKVGIKPRNLSKSRIESTTFRFSASRATN